MLYTNLSHIETTADYQQYINKYEYVMICCGNMGQMCIPVYAIMEEIENDYKNINFFDMEFENPESQVLRKIYDSKDFTNIPFCIYYKNGKVIETTSGIQTKNDIIKILDQLI